MLETPGRWARNLKVAVIDDASDQTIGITTDSLVGAGYSVGYGVTAAMSGVVIAGSGSTSEFNGYLKGIITGVTTALSGTASSIDVKIVSRVEEVGGGSTETKVTYSEGGNFAFKTTDSLFTVTSCWCCWHYPGTNSCFRC